jgi:hypothetical protein
MPFVAAAATASVVVGGYGAYKGAKAQEKAAETAAQVERERMAEDKRRFELNDAAYGVAGRESVNWLNDAMSGKIDPTKALENDPGYQFRLKRGQTAFDRYQAASGHRLGGRAVKEGIQYNQGVASQEYGNVLDRRFRLAGFSGNATPAPSSQLPNIAMQAGQNQANMYANYNNAIQSGLQNYATYRSYNDWQSRLPTNNGGRFPTGGAGGVTYDPSFNMNFEYT